MAKASTEEPVDKKQASQAKGGAVRGKRSSARNQASRKSGVRKASVKSKSISRRVRNRFDLTQDEFAELTGYAKRSIASWEAGAGPSDSALTRIKELDRLSLAIKRIMGQAEVGQWMRKPNAAFEGRTPIQVVANGEADRLWQMVHNIEDGVAN